MKPTPSPRAASTYRLQMSPSFRFGEAAAALPYLAGLGITHAYLSPIAEATPGSTHGYDVADPTRIRDELGGADGFRALTDAAGQHGIRLLIDIVPNHMAATADNKWWSDVLDAGEGSPHAYLFDVDWQSGDGRVRRGPPRSAINYRRFFEIDDLAAVRQEDPRAFDTTHRLVREMAGNAAVDGWRVDHIDGLRDPQQYLDRLAKAAPQQWLVVEKILEPEEVLPSRWPVAGTTGYEFASRALGLFVDPAAMAPLDSIYVELTGDHRTWPDAVRAGKSYALGAGLSTDVARVARAFGDEGLSDVITALAVEWPVYRTYTTPAGATAGDVAVIASTCARVRALLPQRAEAVDRLERALLRESDEHEAADRFQLLTGPAMAKGVEDRAFYDYTRFVALNEVGGNPDHFGVSAHEWHDACRTTVEAWPYTMLTTATHDTKRGEDVRARLAAITESPDWWAEQAKDWMSRHDSIDGPTAYLLLQTLVGAWPLSQERLYAYMQKAAREAGAHTSWAEPNDAYEQAVAAEVRAALGEPERIEAFVQPLLERGRVNALAQALLRTTAPGTPDTYQGTEDWDLSLVDPDNRRPVDFKARVAALRTSDADWPKLQVLSRALQARREFPHAFAGDYTPLETDSDAVVAYARGDDVVVIVPRLTGATDLENSVRLPAGNWVNRLDGFPVALLCR